jgi:dTDP-4-amino-4,6-dideoxygalactose transaminase
MPIHVYGNPCNLEKFEQLADTYGLKLIYDAAHSFGVKVNGNSVLNYGDLSILSFHATKVFNTIEGGAIICPDEKTKKRIDYLKNFGFAGEITVIAPGINAKMNELQAAYGLIQLKYVDSYIAKRKKIAETYRDRLSGIKGITFLGDMENVSHAYSYFPVLVDHEEYGRTRDELYEELKLRNIFGRRYFYPLISQFPTYRGLPSAKPENLPIANQVADKVICLPIYPNFEIASVEKVCNVIKKYYTNL